MVELLREQGTRALRVLDAHLQGRPYLVEDQLSIADIALYAYVHRAEDGGFDLAPYDALRRWLARIEDRPSHVPIDEIPR